MGMGIGVLHNRWRKEGRPDAVLAGVRVLTHPLQVTGSVAQAGVFVGWTEMFKGRALEAENTRLTAEVATLRAENEALASQAAEAVRLRAALKCVRAQPGPLLPAAIIALLPNPLFDTITVNRGTHDRVHPESIVRTPDGLVGQVTEVSGFSAEVMLLTDLNSAVSGLVRRNGKLLSIGIVQGTGRGQPLEMINLKRDDDVRPGDPVYSSGYGGVFPADIPIGRIISLKNEDALFVKTARVEPAAPLPGDLREVYILP